MLKDIVDGLKMVADGIDSVAKITAAVRSGEKYIVAMHPDVQPDLKALVKELGRNIDVVKQASAVLTNFRFAIAADTGASELARFNDYFITSKTQSQHLRKHIEDLRSHCSRVHAHATRISGANTAEGFAKIFTLLRLNSPQREKELGEKLYNLANEDFKVANSAELMLTCLERSLRDIQDALGTGGAMYRENVPAAASLLAEYGPHFESMEGRAAEVIKEIQQSMSALN